MLSISIIAVGKMKEKHYIDAFAEYEKRLSTLCRFSVKELSEVKLSNSPSQAEISAALHKEGEAIRKVIPSGSFLVAMCIEGTQISSTELADLFSDCALRGEGRLCFVVGSSFGLSENIKSMARLRLSMSKMTFPHHLARVMLTEQIYRAMSLNEGGKYHK